MDSLFYLGLTHTFYFHLIESNSKVEMKAILNIYRT